MKTWRQLERIDASMPRHYFAEHLARYAFVQSRLAGAARILDLGCGVGYGTRRLAEEGGAIVGLDLSIDAIRTAKTDYHHPGIRYLVARGEGVPFPDAHFDAVISFEVIEHLPAENHPRYMAEISRLLTPSGSLCLSTPNRQFTAGRANPFHLKEYSLGELAGFLAGYFPRVTIFGQRCQSRAASVYRGPLATGARRLKQRLGVQFLLPHAAKRALEWCLTGASMSQATIDDYEFTEQQVASCSDFLVICHKCDK